MKRNGNYFASSTDTHRIYCIWMWVWLSLLVSSRIDWCLTVILTLRTWAVWDQNPRLSIILPTLYVLLWVQSYIIVGIYVNSMKCKYSESDPWLSSWSISPQLMIHYIQDSRGVSWRTPWATTILYFHGFYSLFGTLVSVNIHFNFSPLIEW